LVEPVETRPASQVSTGSTGRLRTAARPAILRKAISARY